MPGTETDEQRETLRQHYLEQCAHIRDSWKSGRIYSTEMLRLTNEALDHYNSLSDNG